MILQKLIFMSDKLEKFLWWSYITLIQLFNLFSIIPTSEEHFSAWTRYFYLDLSQIILSSQMNAHVLQILFFNNLNKI